MVYISRSCFCSARHNTDCDRRTDRKTRRYRKDCAMHSVVRVKTKGQILQKHDSETNVEWPTLIVVILYFGTLKLQVFLIFPACLKIPLQIPESPSQFSNFQNQWKPWTHNLPQWCTQDFRMGGVEGGEAYPSLLGEWSGEGTVPPPHNFFRILGWKYPILRHSNTFIS